MIVGRLQRASDPHEPPRYVDVDLPEAFALGLFESHHERGVIFCAGREGYEPLFLFRAGEAYVLADGELGVVTDWTVARFWS